jgi:hypothetical protein
MTRWNLKRAARFGYLAGRGLSIESIMADDVITAKSERAVRCAASRLGVPIGGNGLLAVALSATDRRQLTGAAHERGMTIEALVTALLRQVAHDSLVDAVLDDRSQRQSLSQTVVSTLPTRLRKRARLPS